MNDSQRAFLDRAAACAATAGHPFPTMAAAEAALESNWGNSQLARYANNLFGMKQHSVPRFETLDLPTKEFINGAMVAATAHWVKYPDWASCFADRLATLQRLAPSYVNYAAALAATSAEDFVTAVSKSWSTDPQRAKKVISIFQEYTT